MFGGTKRQTFFIPIYKGIILLIVILCAGNYIYNTITYKQEYITELQALGKLNRNQVEKYVQAQLYMGTELALNRRINEMAVSLMNSPNPKSIEEALNSELEVIRRRHEGLYTTLSILDIKRDKMIACSSGNLNHITTNSYHDFVDKVAQTNETIISDIYKEQKSGPGYLLIGKLMGDKNNASDPLVMIIEVEYQQFINNIRESFYLNLKNQTVYLVNNNGYILENYGNITDTYPLLEQTYNNPDILQLLHKKTETTQMNIGQHGDKIMSYSAPIKNSFWNIIIEQNYLNLIYYYIQQGVIHLIIVAIVWIGLLYLKRGHNEQLYIHGKEFEEIVTQIADGKEDIDLRRSDYGEFDGLYDAFHRLRRNLKHQKEKQDIILKIANILAINIELEKLLEELLPNIIDVTKSHWGVFYILNPITNKLEIKASRGLSKNVYREFDINIGEGLVGQAALDHKIKIIKDIPSDTVYALRTFLGNIKPKSIMAVPILFQGNMMGILLLSSIYNYREEQIDIIKVIRYYFGVAISNGLIYERTQRLSKELQFQNQLIQNLNDELEVKVRERTDFLDNIINSIKDYAIISLDKDGYITTWNKGAELLKGYEAYEVIGEPMSILYNTDEIKQDKPEKELQIAKEEGQFIEYGWKKRKDGEKYFADIIITPMYDKNNNLIGFTKIIKDITASKRMEEVLLIERQLNAVLIENSKEALMLINQQGIILEANQLAADRIKYRREELVGAYLQDYLKSAKDFIQQLKQHRSSNQERNLCVEFKNDVVVELNPIRNTEEVRNILIYIK